MQHIFIVLRAIVVYVFLCFIMNAGFWLDPKQSRNVASQLGWIPPALGTALGLCHGKAKEAPGGI